MSEGSFRPDASPLPRILKVTTRAAIFDMDGTLLDTERLYFEAWNLAARDLGKEITPALYGHLIGTTDDDGMTLLEKHWGLRFDTEAFLKRALAEFDRLVRERGLGVRPGVQALLQKLQARGVRLAVATSTYRKKAEAHLTHVGLLQYFEFVLGGDDVLLRKPNPEPFLQSLRRLGCAPEETLVFEDSPAGVTAAVAAGLRCIWVPDLADVARVAQLKETAICDSLEEVAALL